MLVEEVASDLQLLSSHVVEAIRALEGEGKLTGVLDERGKVG